MPRQQSYYKTQFGSRYIPMGAAPIPPSLLRKSSRPPQLQDSTDVTPDREDLGSPATPVGVTIAFRQQAGSAPIAEHMGPHQQRLRTPSPSRRRSFPSPSGDMPRVTSSSLSNASGPFKKQKKPVSSWQVFWEGTVLYLSCLVLPSVVGALYQQWMVHLHGAAETAAATAAEQDAAENYYSTAAKSYYDYYVKPYACSVDPSYYSPTLGSYYTYYVGCNVGDDGSSNAAFLFSPDTTPSQDLQMVAILSVCMALIRSLIVTYTVIMDGTNNAETVQAMVRCKSIGLLSADYGALTPSSSSRFFAPEEEPELDLHAHPDEGEEDEYLYDSHLGLGLDESSNHIDGAEDWANVDTVHTSCEPGKTPEATEAMHMLVAEEPQHTLSASLYAAPRYATALFRLGYSLTASSLAYVWFHRASFWPWFVGGTGTTAACWDLSGGLTLGMDSDFDHRNTVLKRYFLLQASYHWQSIAFHLLSLVMLIWDYLQQVKRDGPARPGTRGFWSVARKVTWSYSRPLLQHLLALVLIAVAYVFSSLRRLGAIGMFACDVSGCFLHLLQILLNKASPRTARWIPLLYYGGVLPSFVTMRLCVWPRLWYSATVESHSWFLQLERTLFPNSALMLKCVLHVWMLLVTYLTLVGLRRLCRHPHLQRTLLWNRANKTGGYL